MSTITLTPDATGKLSVRELFDFFMQQEEPDLVSGAIASLKEKYATESVEEKTARGQRYKAVIKKFRVFFDTFLTQFTSGKHTQNKEKLRALEQESHELEKEELARLESIFGSNE